MSKSTTELSAFLRNLSSQIKEADQDLKKQTAPEQDSLQQLRQSLDDLRMTAWTVSELMHARILDADARKFQAFLRSERLRRFHHMVADVIKDVEAQETAPQSGAVEALFDSVSELQGRLMKLRGRAPRAAGE
jgi:DNA anti-recombination protein RmuC